MRKGLLFIIITIMALGAFGCEQNGKSGPSVGVVDTSRVFRDSNPGKAGIKYLEGLHETMQAELNNLQKDAEAKPDDTALQQKIQDSYMAFQQRMGAEQQNVINLLNDSIQRALDACREQKKLDIIFSNEAALSFSKASDITADIIAEVNKRQVEFKPIAPEGEPLKIETPEQKVDEAPKADAPKSDEKADKPAPTEKAKPAVDKNATKRQ